LFQDGSQSRIQFQMIGRDVELLLGDLKWIRTSLVITAVLMLSPFS